MTQVHVTYMLGQQRPVSGSVTAGYGGFYGGTLTEFTWRAGSNYPTSSISSRSSRGTTSRAAGDANNNLFSTRATYTLSPRMFVSALVQYQSRIGSVTTNARFRWEYLPGSNSSSSTATGGPR